MNVTRNTRDLILFKCLYCMHCSYQFMWEYMKLLIRYYNQDGFHNDAFEIYLIPHFKNTFFKEPYSEV